MNPRDRLIVALDLNSEERAIRMVEILKNDVKIFKVGFELFSCCGPAIVRRIQEADCRIFLDLKFHDIPNTVAKAAAAVTKLGVLMFNVHALGGYDMMKEASDIVETTSIEMGMERPKVLAVTILTSMDEKALKKVGINGKINLQVSKLAALAKDAGLDGVVASPNEAPSIRKKFGKDFLIVTPGVRPVGSAAGDQKRIATPKSAMKAGADYIVVGRPIIDAKDPAAAARAILEEMK